MTFTSPPEITTALTDAALFPISLICLLIIRKYPKAGAVTSCIKGFLIFSGFSCLAGFFGHGFVHTDFSHTLVWGIITLLSCVMVSFYAFAAVNEFLPESARKTCNCTVAIVGVAVYTLLFTFLITGRKFFAFFIGYAVFCGIFASVIHIRALSKGFPHAKLYLFCTALNIIGSLFLVTKTASFNLFYEFDHNSIYHFFLMLSVIPLCAGYKRSAQNYR